MNPIIVLFMTIGYFKIVSALTAKSSVNVISSFLDEASPEKEPATADKEQAVKEKGDDAPSESDGESPLDRTKDSKADTKEKRAPNAQKEEVLFILNNHRNCRNGEYVGAGGERIPQKGCPCECGGGTLNGSESKYDTEECTPDNYDSVVKMHDKYLLSN